MNIQPHGLAPIGAPADRLSLVRVRIWDRAGTHRLERAAGDEGNEGSARILVAGGAHAPPGSIVEEVGRQLGLDVVFLRVVAADLVEVEWAGPRAAIPPGCVWRDSSLDPPANERAAWQRPGWLEGLLPVVDGELTRLGRPRRGPPVQVRHTSVTGMLRIPTERGAVWLKAVPSLFHHEAPVVRWLGRLAADHIRVPQVIAAGRDWWLADEFPTETRGPAGDPLVALARAQLATRSRIGELRALGCPERSVGRLPFEVSRLADRRDLLRDEEREALARALPRLGELCTHLESLGFPATIVHGDVSPGNVRWTGTGWLVYDWTDSCIGHPFVELASPLSYESDPAVAASRARAFAVVWAGVMPRAKVEQALRCSGVVGAVHQMVSYQSIVDAIDRTGGDQAGGQRLVDFLRYWMRQSLESLGVLPEEG